MGALHRLTALKAKNLTTPGRHADGGGLYLAIKSHGKIKGRSWVFLYRCRASGRLRELGLGSANVVSLQAARQSAASARSMLVAGIDPLADKKAKLDALKGARTFGDFTNEFLESALAGFKNEKHRAQWRSTLKNDAAALWPMMLPAITTSDVLAILQPIWNTKPETAKRLRGRIERVLSAAKAANLRDGDNPARWQDNLQPLLGKQHRIAKHHAAIPYAAAPAFMAELRQHHSTSAAALEFCVLTAARTNEVIGAKWVEVDLARKLWTIPADRMKMKRAHEVPLSNRAVEILKSLRSERTGYIFKGAKRSQV
jgi:integrase